MTMIIMLVALLCIIVGAWILCNAWLCYVLAKRVQYQEPVDTRLYDATFDKIIILKDYRRH